MNYVNVAVELDGSRNTQEIIDEFTSHGATVVSDENDADIMYVLGAPEDLIDYVEGISEYAPFEGDVKDLADLFESVTDD